MESRELTTKEKREIKHLVCEACANYDSEYGCLILNCDCYMFGKWYNHNLCKYFVNAVLPLNPELEASLMGKAVKKCKMCGKGFSPNGRQAYCSEKCKETGERKATAMRVKNHRQKKG